MKLVLAASYSHYNMFIRILNDKGKNTAHYKYIDYVEDLQGWERDTPVVKLGNFKRHPKYTEILRECEARFDMGSRRSTPAGFQEGGIVPGSWGSDSSEWATSISSRVEGLTPASVMRYQNEFRGLRSLTDPNEMIMNEEQRSRLYASVVLDREVLGEWND